LLNEFPNQSLRSSSLLYFDQVSFSWPEGTVAIENCSFSISKPGLWMIVGRNGSGKSTLFRLLNGMLDIDSGEYFCELKPFLVFQNPDHQLLLPTCQSDLMLSLPKDLTDKEIRVRIKEALLDVGLDGMESRPIHTLSGGQKQRLALAGALVSKATLLLLDEPTALLDPNSQKSILEIVQKLCKRSQNPITALWITHRLEELEYCDGAAIMENGQIGRWLTGTDLLNGLNSLAVG
tara:strand:- start:68 stop:772 length:705 start_codon:yes stop_codon:yes gene_type:complete